MSRCNLYAVSAAFIMLLNIFTLHDVIVVEGCSTQPSPSHLLPFQIAPRTQFSMIYENSPNPEAIASELLHMDVEGVKAQLSHRQMLVMVDTVMRWAIDRIIK
jgi:hypothetical protein